MMARQRKNSCSRKEAQSDHVFNSGKDWMAMSGFYSLALNSYEERDTN